MRDFAFYNAGIDDASGPRRVLGLARRLVRRLLRPMFFHQEALYRDLQAQIDQLSQQVQALHHRSASADAFRWDAVALSRRLGAIEDHLARAGGPPLGEPASLAPGYRLDAAGRPRPPHGATTADPIDADEPLAIAHRRDRSVSTA